MQIKATITLLVTFPPANGKPAFSTLATIIYKSIFTLHTQDFTTAATDEECCSSETARLRNHLLEPYYEWKLREKRARDVWR